MIANIIDGRKVAKKFLIEVAKKVKNRLKHGKRAPKLIVIIVGSDPASKIYVNSKHSACKEVGIVSHSYYLPKNTSEIELTKMIMNIYVYTCVYIL